MYYYLWLKQKLGFTIRYKIRIVYKSGYVHESWFTKFHVEKNGRGEITSLEYNAVGYPLPLSIGEMSSIESVFKIGAK